MYHIYNYVYGLMIGLFSCSRLFCIGLSLFTNFKPLACIGGHIYNVEMAILNTVHVNPIQSDVLTYYNNIWNIYVQYKKLI